MIPEGWKKKRIGQLCTSIVSGRVKPRSFDGTIPWVTATEMQGRYLPSELQEKHINIAQIKNIGAKLVPSGSVVVTVVGNLGKVAITKEVTVLNQQLQAFVCPQYIHNEYLGYWLEAQKDYMYRIATKTTILYINAKNCQDIIIYYPPLSEQKKISDILLAWDKVIEITKQLLSNSKQKKKALSQQLLTGSRRLSGFSEEWAEQLLDDCVVEYKEQALLQDQALVLTSSQQGLVPQDQYFKGKNIIRRHNTRVNIIRPGYVTYRSRSDTGLFTFNVNNTGQTAAVSMHYPVLNFVTGVNKFFVELFMLKQKIFKAYSVGTSQKVLPISVLKKIKMRIPSKQEQQAIASVLISADNEIEKLQQRINCLRRGRHALMLQLLSGKIRV